MCIHDVEKCWLIKRLSFRIGQFQIIKTCLGSKWIKKLVQTSYFLFVFTIQVNFSSASNNVFFHRLWNFNISPTRLQNFNIFLFSVDTTSPVPQCSDVVEATVELGTPGTTITWVIPFAVDNSGQVTIIPNNYNTWNFFNVGTTSVSVRLPRSTWQRASWSWSVVVITGKEYVKIYAFIEFKPILGFSLIKCLHLISITRNFYTNTIILLSQMNEGWILYYKCAS